MSTLQVVLLIGAVIRLTRLITADTILERPRAWVEAKMPDSVAYLIRCDWCLSIWVGLIGCSIAWYAPDTPTMIVCCALTASLLTGWSVLAQTAIESTVWGEDDDGN